VPSLRDREESIPLLVEHFMQRFTQRLHRPPLTVSPELLTALQKWDWPGNIRELENLIERGVILSTGNELQLDLSQIQHASLETSALQTLHDIEREHIRRVLRDTNGVVGGKHGAAHRLGLKRTTLQYKMKKLDLARRQRS
jgi:formate hydrogenlyase transcriptional activator